MEEGRRSKKSAQPKDENTAEKDKLALEREKLDFEREKFELEKKKVEIGLYVEDFKARWQELLNFENENNRWTTLYVTALLLVIGWILNNSSKYGSLKNLYAESDNAYFIIGIAIVNALYTLAMAFKGYQIQQIAQYQYEFLGDRIWQLSATPFNEWERYRREIFSARRGPEPLRAAYFVLISSLPTIVSYTIIILYWAFEWQRQAHFHIHSWRSFRNWFSVAAFLLVNFILVLSVFTAKLNKRWIGLLKESKARVANFSVFSNRG
jgi:hypothetical protein